MHFEHLKHLTIAGGLTEQHEMDNIGYVSVDCEKHLGSQHADYSARWNIYGEIPTSRISKETDNWLDFTVEQTQQKEAGFQKSSINQGLKKSAIPQNKSQFFSVNQLLLVLLSYLFKKCTREIQKQRNSNLCQLLIWRREFYQLKGWVQNHAKWRS